MALIFACALIPLPASELTLHWMDNSTNEIGFIIERSVNGRPFAVVASTGNDVSQHTDRDLQPATQYSYRVQAYNARGVSDYTTPVSASTSADVPSTPTVTQPPPVTPPPVETTTR